MRFDVAIVGSGPAGLAAADDAQRAGFTVRVYEKNCLAHAIYAYPTHMKFHSTAANLEIGGIPLIAGEDKPTRLDYLEYLRRFVEIRDIDVQLYTEVTRITGALGAFRLALRDRHGEERTEEARFVILATGGYETPQPLGVPGENLPKVRHHFDEAHPYWNQRVFVVGGKNSAVEAALVLARAGAHVTICHRRPTFEGAKYWLRPDIENRIRDGAIEALMPAEIVSIEARHVTVRMLQTGEERRVENDFVLALTGYQPDLKFLEWCGVGFDPQTKMPLIDPSTLETNVPGLFCAGVIVAGNVSSMIFIENARFHGEQIVERLKQLAHAKR